MSLNPQFGSGVLFGIPNAGNIVANPTPQQFGILQEVSVEFKGDTKKLYGMYQLPMKAARGKLAVTAKGKIASLDPEFFSQLYFGQPTAAGVQRVVFNEPHAAGASVVPTNVPTSDLGVICVSAGTSAISPGTQLINSGTATPTTGQYKFSGGDYVFAAADVTAGLTANISYQWNDASHGTTLSLANQLMGFAPSFQSILWNNFGNAMFAIQLNACIMGSISIPTKQEDFWVSDFDMEAFTDASDNLGAIYADQL